MNRYSGGSKGGERVWLFSEVLECFPSFLSDLERGIVRMVRKNPLFAGISLERSAGLEAATFSVHSHSLSETGRDSGGQGETKQRFYQV